VFDTYVDIFKERAREYHSAMTASPCARDAEFQAIVEPIGNAPPGLVCDMPCGGCYLPPYLPQGMTYVGVDPADGFVHSGAAAGRIVQAKIAEVPLPSGSVDYLLSLAGLHHEESLPAVFAEMRRLLRHGGCAVIADVEDGTPPARFLNGFVAGNNPMGHDGRFLDQETASLLETEHLKVRSDELIDVPWQFASLEEAAHFCGNLFGIASAGTQAILDALASEIGLTQSDGQVRLSWTLRRIECEAV
jgi:SAM-dependent methyltransferase